MKFQLALFVAAAASVRAAPTAQSSIEAGRTLPGLDEIQSRYAQAILDRVKPENVGALGCHAAIATAMTESELYMHSNAAVPESINMPHERVGSMEDSVGLFQHRAIYYTDIACNMDATCSTGLFLKDLKNVPGWSSMEAAALCQAIQRSQIPEAYIKNVPMAIEICNVAGHV